VRKEYIVSLCLSSQQTGSGLQQVLAHGGAADAVDVEEAGHALGHAQDVLRQLTVKLAKYGHVTLATFEEIACYQAESQAAEMGLPRYVGEE